MIMPPKRKSVSLWQNCDRCNSIISFKDVSLHGEECDVQNDLRTHSFIANKVLYGYVEDLRIADIPNYMKVFENELVLMSQSALQLCNIPIGSQVVVNIGNEVEIRKAWPSDGSLTSICMLHSGLNWKFGQRVVIKGIHCNAIPITTVNYEVIGQMPPSTSLEHFHSVLKHYFKDRLLLNDCRVPFNYLGCQLILKVESDLDTQLAGLSLSDKTPLLALSTTSWIPKKQEESTPKINPLHRFAGYEEIVSSLVDEVSDVKQRNRCVGVLVYGHHGVGKTLLANSVAESLSVPVISLNGGDISGRNGGRSVKEAFAKARFSAPSVIILDRIDVLTLVGDNALAAHARASLVAGFDSIADLPISVIATAVSPSAVFPSLRRPDRLQTEVELGIPNVSDREKILKLHLGPEPWVAELAKTAHGYVAADLVAAANLAVSLASNSQPTKANLATALAKIGASGMRGAAVMVAPVTLDDIGGMDYAKKCLLQATDWPIHHPQVFQRLGITPPKGVLLYGPPGCSKTMLARALATVSGLNFISIKGSDIFSKWVGESERALREVFARARRVAPSVVFLDEIDALAYERSGLTGHVGDRVLSQLLTELDGVQPLNNVFILAATNRPDRIDKALLRPGRLDRLVYVPLPDSATRIAILKVKLSATPLEENDGDMILNDIAAATKGYSGAELAALCNEAAIMALEENMETTCVGRRHFEQALKVVTPRTPQSLLRIYDEYIKKSICPSSIDSFD